MNSAAPPSQTKCNGFLSWEQQSSTSEIDTTCWGVASALKGAYVNLVEHHDSRPSKPSPDAVLHSLSCLGSAIYQSQPDKRTGVLPPPACLGLEFQRYRQAVTPTSAAAAAAGHMQGDHAALHHEQHVPPVDIELLHAQHSQHVTATSTDSSSSSTIPVEPYAHHHAAGSTPAHDGDGVSSSSSSFNGPSEYHGRPSVVERLQELHAEVLERLDGQDPLWFAKAFSTRAALNWDSMKGMAGQVVESVKADLGLQTEKSEEPK